MHIRYPINLISSNIDETLKSLSALFSASTVLNVSEGTKLDDVNFIGPYNLVKDLYARQSNFDKRSLRFIIDEESKNQNNKQDKKTIANGVYLDQSYSGGLPFLMLYKIVDALNGKPVLISENYLTPGELVVVPETSELFVVLLFFEEQAQNPNGVKWYRWFSDKEIVMMPNKPATEYKINYEGDYSEADYKEGKTINLEVPLLDSSDFSSQIMSWDEPVVQLYPIITDEDAKELLHQIKACKAWIRRTGENHIIYTQETFDILEYSMKPDSPAIFGKIVQKLQSPKLLKIASKLSGMELTELLEVYSFHMQSNEYITKHADGTIGGQLLLRFNWLLQSPTGREHDLRFWKGVKSETPITRYKAIPNSATIFYVGDATPHDLTPLPENC